MNAAATTGKFSDFTYMLSMAKSAAKPAATPEAVMANARRSSRPPSAYLMSPRPYPGRGALFHG